MTTTPEEKCCDKCYSTYTTDDYPDHQTLDACINRSCECHTSKGKTLCNGFGFELRYPNGLPDTTEIEEMVEEFYKKCEYERGENSTSYTHRCANFIRTTLLSQQQEYRETWLRAIDDEIKDMNADGSVFEEMTDRIKERVFSNQAEPEGGLLNNK